MTPRKIYVGDGVYAEIHQGMVILTTEDGIQPTNRIVLEEEVWQQLLQFVQAHARALSHASEDSAVSLTCLSRTLDPKDYDQLEIELPFVDAHPNTVPHEHRRWEYALALHAIKRWRATGGPWEGPLCDIGGAGSAFHYMLRDYTSHEVIVIDPALVDGYSLEEYVSEGGAPLAKVVTCLSVIEHVKDLDRFCYHLSCLVAPGGLLVLTMDYWNRCGPDTTGNKDLRERLFCPKTYAALRNSFAALHLTAFGGVDTTWHGTHVWDYSFASLVLEKRR